MIYIAAYLIILVLFLVGNKRWGDRMARMDADMEQALGEMIAAKSR
jgi:hypothetical protein